MVLGLPSFRFSYKKKFVWCKIKYNSPQPHFKNWVQLSHTRHSNVYPKSKQSLKCLIVKHNGCQQIIFFQIFSSFFFLCVRICVFACLFFDLFLSFSFLSLDDCNIYQKKRYSRCMLSPQKQSQKMYIILISCLH